VEIPPSRRVRRSSARLRLAIAIVVESSCIFYRGSNGYSAGIVAYARERLMPEIYVHAVKGRTLDQKRALIKDITDAVVKNFSVPVEAVTIEIIESEPTAKAKGGVLFSEMRR
jgi:4-oxalocrotonate tautomerase